MATKEKTWHYVRTNSKGETVFKRYTKETMEDAISFLEVNGIEYEERRGAKMLWVYFDNKKYSYYPTTGRWNKYKKGGYPDKHYMSKGIEDFYNRFLTK